MTADEWLSCPDPRQMLAFLSGRASNRKLRLFACGCYRLIWDLLPDDSYRDAVLHAEHVANKDQSRPTADQPHPDSEELWFHPVMLMPRNPVHDYVTAKLGEVIGAIRTALHEKYMHGHHSTHPRFSVEREELKISDLLRHIIGTPFKPYRVPGAWPLTVIQLAESLSQGQDCGGPLSDALEETGHQELAEHFRKDRVASEGLLRDGLDHGQVVNAELFHSAERLHR